MRNIASNNLVAVVVDHYSDDWQQLAWVQLRGRAALLYTGERYAAGLALLEAKYPQYQAMPLSGRPMIVVEIEQLRGWRAAGGE